MMAIARHARCGRPLLLDGADGVDEARDLRPEILEFSIRAWRKGRIQSRSAVSRAWWTTLSKVRRFLLESSGRKSIKTHNRIFLCISAEETARSTR